MGRGLWSLVFGPGNHRTKYQTPNTKLQTACGDLEGGYDAGADGGGVAAVRPPPLFSQAAAAAAGLFGGKFWPLQGRLAASFGRCRSLWRQLAAAGLSGGKVWPLQVCCTRPSFNGAAVKYFLLSSSLLFSSSIVPNKNKNNTELQFSIV